jgi:soluble lytic murein transglycosylase-like protein
VRQRRLLAGAVVAAALAAAIVALTSGGGPPPLPLPGIGRPARAGDPFSYMSGRDSSFVARAAAGSSHVLFTKSPGGAPATAARVARWRPLIDAATRGSGVDPDLLEGIVFVESAGRPDVIAGSDPAGASGLTQILAETGQTLLGMPIDLARSRSLTAAIDRAAGQGNGALVARLVRRRAQVDDRFNPRRALAATVRYLELARRRLGRADLAVVSYHMGIGNLTRVLDDYDGGTPVPYVRLYFDTAPDHHPAAYRLLAGFGDDSSLYYWKVLAAARIMKLYRTDRDALNRLSALQTATDSAAYVLHPPDRSLAFADPGDLDDAYANRTVLPLPANGRALGLAYDPSMGSEARQAGASPALYRGLRPAALDLLIELAARGRAL